MDGNSGDFIAWPNSAVDDQDPPVKCFKENLEIDVNDSVVSSVCLKIPTVDEKEKHQIQCSFCHRQFAEQRYATRHQQTCSKNIQDTKPWFTCRKCGISCNRKDNLNVHMKKCGKINDSSSKTLGKHAACLMPDCSEVFFHKTSLIAHLKEVHSSQLVIEDPQEKNFSSFSEFQVWKDNEERRTYSYFSRRRGKHNSHDYYYCQHDGSEKLHSKRLTSKRNIKGTIKTGKVCIAMMKVMKKKNGNVLVTYFPTHNHVCSPTDLCHQPLAESTSAYIDQQICIGLSPTKIQRSVVSAGMNRNSSEIDVNITRDQMISVRRIRERVRLFKNSMRLHKDEAKSLYLLAIELSKEQDCVLLYKPYGSNVVIGPKEVDELPNSNDLFMFGIQTKRQLKLLEQFSQNIVVVDETHGTSQHKYRLLSLMVVDNNNHGWVVGHLVSSKSDASTLKFFFKAIKQRAPILQINCVISDDDPALINGMESGFQESLRHILCKWHFLKALQENLRSKGCRNQFTEMYPELRAIVNTKSTTDFSKMCNAFFLKYEKANETLPFLEYFKKCLLRSDKWAMCHRQFFHGHVDTTGHLESFHNRLKTKYLKRKVNRRLDDLIHILLEVEWDDHLARVRLKAIGLSHSSSDISRNHKRGMLLPDNTVRDVDSNVWEIKSCSQQDLWYTIVCTSASCNVDLCFCKCTTSSCFNLCVHMYVCSCPDKNPLCKHIHKVHSVLCRGLVVSEEDKTKEQNNSVQIPEPVFVDGSGAKVIVPQIEENLISLSNIIKSESSHIPSHLLQHCNIVLRDLVKKCEYFNSLPQVKVPEMTSTENFNPKEKLKTQVSQVASFRKPQRPKRHCMFSGVTTASAGRNLLVSFGEVEDDNMEVELHKTVNFTPSIHYAPSVGDVILKCGDMNVTLLHLKSLELYLEPDERSVCATYDPNFNVGWLYSSVLDAYLYHLSENNSHIFSVPSEVSLSLYRGGAAKRLFNKESCHSKTLFLFPANLSGNHWTMFAVCVDSMKILFFDPLQAQFSENYKSLLIQIGHVMKCLFPNVVSWKFSRIMHIKQLDTVNCGPFVCFFASQLVEKKELTSLECPLAFRRHIYECIAGGCLKRKTLVNEFCGACNVTFCEDDISSSWIACCKCEQWYHFQCVNMCIKTSTFVCPM